MGEFAPVERHPTYDELLFLQALGEVGIDTSPADIFVVPLPSADEQEPEDPAA